MAGAKAQLVDDSHTTQIARKESGNKKPRPNIRSECLKEVINVFVDLIRSFLVDKVSTSFHYNYFLQKWHVFLEPTLVYVFLGAWSVIGQVKVSNNEFCRYFYLAPCPRGGELPVSAMSVLFISARL